jgi:hypothetical protein
VDVTGSQPRDAQRRAEALAIANRTHQAQALLRAKLTRPGPATWWNDVGTDEFVALVASRITPAEAEAIRTLRAAGTWREVAEACHDAYRDRWQVDWVAGQTAEVGMAIGIAAAHKLGDDPMAAPWTQ